MHSHDLSPFAHSHVYADAGQRQRERALAAVTLLTLVTKVLELVVGWWTGSLALAADGWHMGAHALALRGAVLARRLSERASARPATLAACTSGLVLLGLVVNLASVWLFSRGTRTAGTHAEDAHGAQVHAGQAARGRDHNFSAAYCTSWPTPSPRCWPSARWPAAPGSV